MDSSNETVTENYILMYYRTSFCKCTTSGSKWILFKLYHSLATFPVREWIDLFTEFALMRNESFNSFTFRVEPEWVVSEKTPPVPISWHATAEIGIERRIGKDFSMQP